MRVLIEYDADGWAQHMHAAGLQRYAPDGYSVTIQRVGKERPQHDKSYCINFASAGIRDTTCLASHAWMYERNNPRDWTSRAVNRSRCMATAIPRLRMVRRVICRNRELAAFAKPHCRFVATIPVGIDPLLFYPLNRKQRKMRVGWCGQVGNDPPEGCVKGYREIFLPLKERLQERYDFEANTRTASEALPWTEMAEWYRSLDVFISTSSNDGTPNPPFQAAACGCAVIGTDIGQLGDWKALRECDMVVPTYRNAEQAELTIDAIEERLKKLEENRKEVAEVLLHSIETEYSYRVLAPKTLEFICQ